MIARGLVAMMAMMAMMALAVLSQPAMAEPKGDVVEAGKRFNAGVTLYNEADYRAALVEFKRAFDIAPNPAVLYNIGQTHYQLQNYAAAYLTLTRYLAESGNDAAHKGEVNQTLQTLQNRIGKIDVMTNVPGADVRIDDEVVGKTPLPAPVLVSVGRRKVEITMAGREPVSRIIDVAAGDTVRQEVTLVEPRKDSGTPLPGGPSDAKAKQGSALVPALWVTTGLLAVGAVVTGVIAYRASSDLETERGRFPADRDALADKSDRVKLFSGVADGLGVAALAVGTTALVVTILRRGAKQESSTKVGVMRGGVVIGRNF